jgi:cytochrome c-type biogenesis protein CcmH/NrfG/RNA polymerase subunit RPABC4/transcription elongation factor Spt4
MKPKLLCSKCGFKISIGDTVCPKCGSSIDWSGNAREEATPVPGSDVRTCPKCGTENLSEAEFCTSCGTRLQGEKQKEIQKGKSGQIAGKGSESKGKESKSKPLFSAKVIFGFMGALLAFVVAMELFFGRDQSPLNRPPDPDLSSMPSAEQQLANRVAELEEQVNKDPSDMQSLRTLANLCQDGRFLDKAITYYRRFLEKNPKDADARVDLGICYYEKDNTAEAAKEMRTALKYQPKHVQAHYNLGIVSLKARKIQEANEWFRKTIALAPPNSDIAEQAKQILEQHSSPLIQNK